MRISKYIWLTFFLPLCFLCSLPASVAFAGDTATNKTFISASSDRLVQEANEILNKARQLLASGKYSLAERSFSSLLKSRYSSVRTQKLSVAIYGYLSEIYNKLGDPDLSLQKARVASDISLSIDNDPYESWPSIKYGLDFLEYWRQKKTAYNMEVEPEDPLIDILQMVDRRLKQSLHNRDQTYLASVASNLSLGYWRLSTYYARKRDVDLSINYALRGIDVLKKYNPDNIERKYNLLGALSLAYKSKYKVPNSRNAEKLFLVDKEIFSLSRQMYGESDDRTLLNLKLLASSAAASGNFERSIEYANFHYDLTSDAYGVHSHESLSSLENLAMIHNLVGQDGLRAQVITKMINNARLVYGSNSGEYARVLIDNKHALSGAPKEFVEKELLRLEIADSTSRLFPRYTRDEILDMIKKLGALDAIRWESDQFFKLYYAMIRPFDYKSLAREDALNLSSKFIEAAINIWGEGSTQHLQSVSTAAFFSSYYDRLFGSKLFVDLEKIAVNNFPNESGILSKTYLEIAQHWRRMGDGNISFSKYIRKYLESRFAYYKNTLAFLGTEQRLSQIQADESFFNMIYADAASGRLEPSIASFARINRNGLLTELESQYKFLESNSESTRSLVEDIRRLNSKLSVSGLDPTRRKSLVQMKFDIESRLASKYGLSPLIFDVNSLKKVIPEGSVLTQFKLVDINQMNASEPDYQYIAILDSPSENSRIVRIGSAEKINNILHDLLEQIVGRTTDYERVGKDLYQELFLPIEKYLRDKDIIFVLDSDLHLLPLALEELRINGGKSVSLLSSSRDLFADESASAFSDVPVIVASPDYGASVRTSSNSYQTSSDVIASLNISRSRSLVGMDWEPLPASKKEGDALHSILGGKYLFGSNATKKAVLDNINSPSILHIATHAYYAAEEALGSREGMRNIATDSLLRAGVVLAGANISENRADSYLTALEVSGLNLSGTNLVTLSACDTALGNILGSEGVFGLQRALSVAGSRSTLLSLWKVDDNSTSDFMKRFYSKLVQGMGKYDALTEVREEFRLHPVPAWRHPYYWAAFRLSGDTGPIPVF